jgi:ribosomal protein S18 acetylase RimI-like enzyme
MHIRLAGYEDLSKIARLGSQAFKSETVFGWLYPLRDSNPKAFEETLYRQAVTRFLTPGWVTIVAVGESSDSSWCSPDEIVGYGVWLRDGGDPGAQYWNQDPLSQKLQRWTWWTQHRLGLMTGWYVAANDLSRLDKLHHIANDIYEHIPDSWYLDTLGVNPQYQRKGIGRMLLDWGVERANSENVPVLLESTAYGEGLYRKAGFLDFDRVELTESIGMPAMILPPPGKSIEDYRKKEGKSGD